MFDGETPWETAYDPGNLLGWIRERYHAVNGVKTFNDSINLGTDGRQSFFNTIGAILSGDEAIGVITNWVEQNDVWTDAP